MPPTFMMRLEGSGAHHLRTLLLPLRCSALYAKLVERGMLQGVAGGMPLGT